MAAATAEFEKVAGSNQRRRSSNTPCHTKAPAQPVGKARIEIDLDQDRDGKQHDHERLCDDLLALKPKQHDQRRQQCNQRDRLQRIQGSLQRCRSIGQQRTTPQLRDNDGNNDIQHDRYQQGRPRHGYRSHPSKRPTSGAKANTMMTSFSATWLRV